MSAPGDLTATVAESILAESLLAPPTWRARRGTSLGDIREKTVGLCADREDELAREDAA